MTLAFDHRGLLPAGCHEVRDWTAFSSMFAFNAQREAQLAKLKAFIGNELASVARGLELVIGGSYLTDKATPGDIDCTISLPPSLVPRRQELIILSAQGDKSRIFEQYGVEFYLTLLQKGCSDFRAFFAYVGEKSALARGLNASDLRGTVKVKQWAKL